jgi:hypothetical protein
MVFNPHKQNWQGVIGIVKRTLLTSDAVDRVRFANLLPGFNQVFWSGMMVKKTLLTMIVPNIAS